MIRRPPRSTRTDTLFPYTTLFRSVEEQRIFISVAQRRGDRQRDGREQRAPPQFAPQREQAAAEEGGVEEHVEIIALVPRAHSGEARHLQRVAFGAKARSEERRVGKEGVRTCRTGWSRYH